MRAWWGWGRGVTAAPKSAYLPSAGYEYCPQLPLLLAHHAAAAAGTPGEGAGSGANCTSDMSNRIDGTGRCLRLRKLGITYFYFVWFTSL